MEIFHKEVDNQPEDDQRLPWRKPKFQHLTIAIDTVFGTASEGDSEGKHFAKFPPPG